MTTYNFSVRRGDTVVPVTIDSDDDLGEAAIQAAAAARDMMESERFHVYADFGIVDSFSSADIDEWWA